jgi:hypothetical protein
MGTEASYSGRLVKYLALFTAISIAAVAAYFSIIGLASIFSGAFISVVVMASILEVGKLVAATWLHLEWRSTGWFTRIYLTFAVIVLMFITSMGIFGYLSKAHMEQSINDGGINELQIQNIERRIENERRTISDAETVLSQLDASVQTLIDFDRIRGDDGAINVRENQKEERQTLNETIDESYQTIEIWQSDLFELKRDRLALEIEVGPIKYISELIYGENAENYFDKAVRLVILLIVVVFDPLAIMLLIVSTKAIREEEYIPPPIINEDQIMVMR